MPTIKESRLYHSSVAIVGRNKADFASLPEIPRTSLVFCTPRIYIDTKAAFNDPPEYTAALPKRNFALFAFHGELIDSEDIHPMHSIKLYNQYVDGVWVNSSISAIMVNLFNMATGILTFDVGFYGTLFEGGSEEAKQLLGFVYWLSKLDSNPSIKQITITDAIATRLKGLGYLDNYTRRRENALT